MSISIVDVKRAVMRRLSFAYPTHDIYAENMPTDFKRPSFYMYFVPLESNHDSRLFITKSTMLKIDYYSPNRTFEENLIMADDLESIFHRAIKVKDRFFSVLRTNSEYMDDVLTFTLTVNFDDGVKVIFLGDDFTEEDPDLGYIDGKVDYMKDLELK